MRKNKELLDEWWAAIGAFRQSIKHFATVNSGEFDEHLPKKMRLEWAMADLAKYGQAILEKKIYPPSSNLERMAYELMSDKIKSQLPPELYEKFAWPVIQHIWLIKEKPSTIG